MRFLGPANRAGVTEVRNRSTPGDDEGHADVLLRPSLPTHLECDRGQADVLGHRRGQLRRVARVARPSLGTGHDAEFRAQSVVGAVLHSLHEYVQVRSLSCSPPSAPRLTFFDSHESFFHLLFNCMALASFGMFGHGTCDRSRRMADTHTSWIGAAAGQQLMLQFKKVEQERGAVSEASPKWHLLALFISGQFQTAHRHAAHILTYPPSHNSRPVLRTGVPHRTRTLAVPQAHRPLASRFRRTHRFDGWCKGHHDDCGGDSSGCNDQGSQGS